MLSCQHSLLCIITIGGPKRGAEKLDLKGQGLQAAEKKGRVRSSAQHSTAGAWSIQHASPVHADCWVTVSVLLQLEKAEKACRSWPSDVRPGEAG